MKRINALKFRQSFGMVLDQMEAENEAIVIERSSKPVAVLVPYAEFERRFVDQLAEEKRQALLERYRSSLVEPLEPTLQAIRDIRYGDRH